MVICSFKISKENYLLRIFSNLLEKIDYFGGIEIITSSIVSTQPKRINKGDRVTVSISKAVQSNSIGNSTSHNIGINKPSHLRRVVTRPHVDETVSIGHNAVSTVVAKDHLAGAGSGDLLAIELSLSFLTVLAVTLLRSS